MQQMNNPKLFLQSLKCNLCRDAGTRRKEYQRRQTKQDRRQWITLRERNERHSQNIWRANLVLGSAHNPMTRKWSFDFTKVCNKHHRENKKKTEKSIQVPGKTPGKLDATRRETGKKNSRMYTKQWFPNNNRSTSLISNSREVQCGNLRHMCIALLNCSPECLAPQAHRIQSTRRVLWHPTSVREYGKMGVLGYGRIRERRENENTGRRENENTCVY